MGYIDPQTGLLVSATMTDGIPENCGVADKETVFSKCDGLWAWVINHRQPLLTNQPMADPRSAKMPPGHMPIQRFLSVPAVMGGTLVGLISLANSPGTIRNMTKRW